jgi:hypothetical protein
VPAMTDFRISLSMNHSSAVRPVNGLADVPGWFAG